MNLRLKGSQIGARVLEDVRACVPASRGAGVVSVRAVKEKRATFAPLPGLARHRPGPTLPDGSGVVLAGDYTDTGWPATMEGATRSGYIAAAAVLGIGHRELLAAELKVSALAGAIAGR